MIAQIAKLPLKNRKLEEPIGHGSEESLAAAAAARLTQDVRKTQLRQARHSTTAAAAAGHFLMGSG